MQKNKLNNVIVLKELSSNIVEEAIVLLKPNVNLRNHENMDNPLQNEKSENKKKIIVKEAEYVIENCIYQMEIKNKQIENFKIEKRYKLLKRVTIALAILNFFLLVKIF